jgi:hypothetical protein
MRKLLVVLLLLIVSVVGLGFYLGWFGVSTSRDPNSGKTEVELTIDRDKMKSDTQKAQQQITDGASKPKERPEGK